MEILYFLHPILRVNLSSVSAVPRAGRDPYVGKSYGNPIVSAPSTEGYLKLRFCDSARRRGTPTYGIPMEILHFLHPVLRVNLSSDSAIPRAAGAPLPMEILWKSYTFCTQY